MRKIIASLNLKTNAVSYGVQIGSYALLCPLFDHPVAFVLSKALGWSVFAYVFYKKGTTK